MPEEVNLRQVGRDVEDIAKALTQGKSYGKIITDAIVPGFQFAQVLRDVVTKARRKRVLPPSSRASSPPPTQGGAGRRSWNPVPRALDSANPSNTIMPAQMTNFTFDTSPPMIGALGGPGMPIGTDGMASHLDFLYAEQLFNDTAPRDLAPRDLATNVCLS